MEQYEPYISLGAVMGRAADKQTGKGRARANQNVLWNAVQGDSPYRLDVGVRPSFSIADKGNQVPAPSSAKGAGNLDKCNRFWEGPVSELQIVLIFHACEGSSGL